MPEDTETKKTGRTPAELEEFLGQARKRFSAAAEDEKELREKFSDDLRFASPDGEDQWDAKMLAQRKAANRPALTFPRCHIFVQQVSNEARQNKPQVKYAVSDGGDEDTAEIMEGLARYIQYSSDAQVAYETAVEYSAGGSFGYYRFLTEYCDYDSDDLDLKVVPVLDPLTVYGILVPAIFGRKPKYWFVIQDIPKDEFKAEYPDSEMASLSWDEAEKECDGWVGSEYVRIAEYWWVTEERTKGSRRPKITIRCCKTNGLEILPGDDGESSETIWPGTKCNIMAVLGAQMIRDGKPTLSSIVRPQKTAQQLINYSKSRIAETLAQAPVSPYMTPEGSIAGYEAQWETLNTKPRPNITYKAYDASGRALPRPERDVSEAPIGSLSAFVAQEIDDMKATTGIYDASLGAQGNETSGRAILSRQQQSNLATMHFMDNLERSFKQAGEVMGELIPKIYDAARTIKILGPDEAQKIVKINQMHTDETGKDRHYDLAGTKGSWVVTMGKSYSSKRMEAFDNMQTVIQANPDLMNVIGDIMFRNYDGAGAEEMADRLHKMLPPQLQDDQNELPPQAQAAVAQAQQQSQMIQGEMQKLQFEKAAKVAEHQGKMQQIAAQFHADMALAAQDKETKLAVAEISTKAQSQSERDALVADLWKQFHAQAHDSAMAAQDHAHSQQMAAQQAAHQQDAQAQQADAASAQSAQEAVQQQAQQAAQPDSAQV
jgi:hypothetical protein